VLAGPTAVGKTAVSLEVALPFCEIVSADSVQVFRYLDIGSGKVSREERSQIPHHMIDIIDPDEQYSAGRYCTEAFEITRKLYKRNKIPFFVGGTGLYLDSFFKGIADIPPIDSSIRKEIIKEFNEKGQNRLYNDLCSVDKDFASGVHPNDKQRIIRGLEVFRGTGRTITSFYNQNRGYGSEKTLYLGIYLDREILIERINRRVDKMLAQGLVHEVESLRSSGYGAELPSMKSIGYYQINKYIDGDYSLKDEAVEDIKIETRKYAKRQMTWFKRNKKCIWFRPEDSDKIKKNIIDWFESIKQ
jgi:tRNA dimethylallyltransferase